MIGIINYKIGNLASVQNAIMKLNKAVKIEDKAENIKQYSHLILPGVGAFGDAMEHLRQSGMQEAIMEFVKSGKPLLGICLGMQLLFEKSYEFGEHLGLGLMSGEVVPFLKEDLKPTDKIPHIGWNIVLKHKESPLFKGLEMPCYLYFVHSFCVKDMSNVVGISNYGAKFASIVQKDNIFGIQPHPEKSHNVGLKILENFTNL